VTTSVDTSTPAARASALTQPRDAAPGDGNGGSPAEEEGSPRRHPLRTSLILIVLAGLLAGGMWAGWRYTQSKYYVGVTDDGTVAVFQGIPGEIAGFDLSTVDFLSNTKIDELTPVAQEKVREGIPSSNQGEAREQLETLLDPNSRNVLPFCPSPTSSPSQNPTATESPGAVSSNPAASITATPSLTISASPTAASTSEPAQPTGPPDCRPVS
jgi:protein phosphatase